VDYGGYVMGLTANRNYCRRLIDAGYDPANEGAMRLGVSRGRARSREASAGRS
jgi:hypothetical protein